MASIVVTVMATTPSVGIAVPPSNSLNVAVGPQYDTTHVYVAPEDFDAFVASVLATFGGTASKRSDISVTPTPSTTMSQLVRTPVGVLSVFGFKTPIPYPFGTERTGYLVTDLGAAVRAARSHGAAVIVAPFADMVGKDAVIQWPGGVNMQFYWHTKPSSFDALRTIPENRIYLSPDRADDFITRFVGFARGKVVADDSRAPGVEIGRPDEGYRCIQLESRFGKLRVLVTNGHLPYPYGHENTGYEVSNLQETLDKAVAAGVTVLNPPYRARGRESAMVRFPGGYIAEIHSP
jgi:hypothetical protein